MNPFRKSADAARLRGESALARRISTEGRIVHKLIAHALAEGLLVSVYDGEEWPLKCSSSPTEIINACFSTDEDVLVFRTPMKLKVGSVSLVYGNGNEVISDYSAPDLDAFSIWLKPVEDYAEEA